MKLKTLLLPAYLCVLVLSTSSCTETQKATKKDSNQQLIAQRLDEAKSSENGATITKLTLGDQGFSTLASAINGTEFKDMLNNEGPYTIFAPVNAAFEKLSEASVKKMLAPENLDQLTAMLNYHIIPGEINEDDIIRAIDEWGGSVKLKTLGGKKLTAGIKDNRVFLIDEMGNGGTLVTTDIKAANGMLHAIDKVMMPKK